MLKYYEDMCLNSLIFKENRILSKIDVRFFVNNQTVRYLMESIMLLFSVGYLDKYKILTIYQRCFWNS